MEVSAPDSSPGAQATWKEGAVATTRSCRLDSELQGSSAPRGGGAAFAEHSVSSGGRAGLGQTGSTPSLRLPIHRKWR